MFTVIHEDSDAEESRDDGHMHSVQASFRITALEKPLNVPYARRTPAPSLAAPTQSGDQEGT